MTQVPALGRTVAYPSAYDPTLLFSIGRELGRATLGMAMGPLPFTGADRWNAYEVSWLDPRGKPVVATLALSVPATTPRLVESKSLKLYLNSFNATRFEDVASVHARIAGDLAQVAGGTVDVVAGLPPIQTGSPGVTLDTLDVAIDDYGPPNATYLQADPRDIIEETLRSDLLKSNCPVTGQPDWASVHIGYRGPRIDRAGLLRYLVSFRDHAEFHEQCVERIFTDLMARCSPQSLCVEARYTRRGGLDINPWRATPDREPPPLLRDVRQ
ncbi:MAG: NADPH-dependent 7-cyano-7-deazaguanine reductase QueF [Luteimonas sp.]